MKSPELMEWCDEDGWSRLVLGVGPGGRALRSEWVPTAKQPPRAGAVNVKVHNGAIECNDLDVDVRNVDQFLSFRSHQRNWLMKTFKQ